MNCEFQTDQLVLLLYGELTPEETRLAEEHVRVCSDCAAELDALRAVHAEVSVAAPVMPGWLLQDARRDLRVRIADIQESTPAPAAKSSWWNRWRSLSWQAAGAAAMLTIGFLGGRAVPAGERGSEPLAAHVRSVQPVGDGRVQVVVEDVRQRVIEGSPDEERMIGLLVAAARETDDPGVRVEALEALQQHAHPQEVRAAFLAALRADDNPGVRLKALEGLQRTGGNDHEMVQAIRQVLLTDDNPGVRTQALDLISRNPHPQTVGLLQEVVARDDDSRVRQKCQKILYRMNASIDTF